jgi:hypothetical protein
MRARVRHLDGRMKIESGSPGTKVVVDQAGKKWPDLILMFS